jgi:PII-like signaling protein
MLCLIIHIKGNDEFNGKKLHDLLREVFIRNYFSGCTNRTGVDGFGKRRSTNSIEAVIINMPVGESLNIEPLLPEIKRIVGDNGLITLHEVDAV